MQSLGAALCSGVEVSEACGFHVHVDARDYSTADLRRLIILYASVEKLLFALVSPEREDTKYSKACGSRYLEILTGVRTAKDWRNALHRMLYADAWYNKDDRREVTGSNRGSVIRSLKKNKFGDARSRYNGLNLHTFFFRRTVEFRMHEGTQNIKTITNFALLCGWIVESAYKLSESRLCELLTRYTDGSDILRAILPTSVHDWLSSELQRRQTEEHDSLERSQCTDAQSIYALEPSVFWAHAPKNLKQGELFICAE
jgi:hypothetical protein